MPPLPLTAAARGRRPLVLVLLTALAAGGLAGAGPSTAAAAEPAVAGPAVAGPVVAGLASSVRASDGPGALPWGTVSRGRLRAGAALLAAPRPGPAARLTASPVSTFNVTFIDDGRTWTQPAKDAFNAALDVWERTIDSAVPIEVEARATVLAPGQLGGAGPSDVLRNEKGTPTRDGDDLVQAQRTLADDVFEPLALFNARTGRDAAPGEPDISAEFDPSQGFLYFGLDASPTPSQYDFRSIVLHEIGHGLGIIGTGEVDRGGRATLGVAGANGNSGVRAPLAFDVFTYATSAAQAGNGGARLTSLANGSAALRTALTGDRLYWAGQLARSAVGGAKVRLFAPAQCGPSGGERPCPSGESSYQFGSSYGHVDERTYPRGTVDSLMTPVVESGETFTDPGQLTMGLLADLGYAVPAIAGSRYTALDPVRLLDTRTGTGAQRARVATGGVVDLLVAGTAGVPAEATAVVLNVTGVAPSAATDVRVYPTPVTPTPVPRVSNLNLAKGGTRANLVTVPVGNNGRVRLRNSAGSVDLLADLAGFYAPTAASLFTPMDPVRVLDTRKALGTPTTTPVAAGGLLDLQVTGPAGRVPDSATAVILTVTAVGATTGTDVRAYPAADTATVPLVSNINADARTAVPNVVIVKIGQDGRVRLRNSQGAVHLLADLAGYYDDSTTGSLFRPVEPARILDTRTRLGRPAGSATRVGPGQAIDLRVGGVAQVPRSARAAVLTVTGAEASATTDVRVYPSTAGAVPVVSNLNLSRGQTAADLVVATLGGGRVRLRNAAGSVALLADVSGWFGPPA